MSKRAWSFSCLVGAVIMAGISCVSAFLGGCPTMLDGSQGSVPMRCFWTFVADTYVGALGIVIALASMTCKDKSGRRASAASFIAVALVAACMPASFAIGLCGDATMHCHGSAHIVWALCALALIVGIVEMAKANPAAANLPKRSL